MAQRVTTITFRVTEADTAIALGSGDLPVLATPRLLAWCEAATVKAAAAQLSEGQTSVGVDVSLRHRRATPIGARVLVAVSATTVHEGRAVFDLVAYELAEEASEVTGAAGSAPTAPTHSAERAAGVAGDAEAGVIATGRITRAVVDRAAFLALVERG